MYFSINRFTGDGTTTQWEFNFSGGYIDQAHVKVLVIDPLGVETIPTYTWVGPNTISIVPAVASGSTLEVYRDTPKNLPLVDYTDGAIVSEKNLDTTAEQSVFVAAEVFDRFSDTEDLVVGAATAAVEAAELAAVAAGTAASDASSAQVSASNAAVSAATSQTALENIEADLDALVGGDFSDFLRGANNLSDVANASTARINLGLGNVDNTADVDKPVSTAQAAAIVVASQDVMGTLTAASGSDIVGFQQSGTGAVARTVQDKMRELVSVQDFGAVGDGVTDDTAAIQAAINSGAKKVIASPGLDFRIVGTLSIESSKIEIDFQHSQLTLDDPSGTKDHILIGTGISQVGGVKINNVTFTRAQAATSGYAINTNLIGVCEIKRCRIFGNNKIHGGIKIYRGIIVNIENNYIDNCINNGIYLGGADLSGGRTIDVTIRKNRIEGGVTALATWDFVEGVFCRDNIFFNTSASAVSASASSNTNGLVSFKFQENDFDTCGGAGLYLDNIDNVQVTDNWFSSIASAGGALQVKSNVNDCVIVGNQIYPDFVGIRVEGTDTRIAGNIVSGASIGVDVQSSAVRTGVSANTLKGQYAVDLKKSVRTHVTGNIFSTSLGGVIGDGGVGCIIHGNSGDPTSGASSYVSVGASPFTYTAGHRPEFISVYSGAVSLIQVGSNNTSFTSNQSVVLAPGQSMTVTYSSAPFMLRNRL